MLCTCDNYTTPLVPCQNAERLHSASCGIVAHWRGAFFQSATMKIDTEQFWKLVEVTPSCWIWHGPVAVKTGKPRVPFKNNISPCAHRVSYTLLVGPLVKAQQLRVKCGNKLCVKPGHLALKDELERFWTKVQLKGTDECWPWIGERFRGYGTFRLDSGKRIAAHRYSYTCLIGPIPKGLLACHHCDNPPCCNPRHIFLGTTLDNVRDKIHKGRASNQHGVWTWPSSKTK